MSDPRIARSLAANQLAVNTPDIGVTVNGDAGPDSFVVHLYAHEYEGIGGRTHRIVASSLDVALADLARLWENRGIRGRLVWRELTVSLDEWK